MNRRTRIVLTIAVTGFLVACTTPSMQASDNLLSYELLGAAIMITREPDTADLQETTYPDRSGERLVSAR